MKALITGANGFVGTWLTRRLVAEQHAVTALVRSDAPNPLLEGVPHTQVLGDAMDESVLLRALEDVDVVFHLAGVRRAAHREEFFRVNAEGVRLLGNAMLRQKTRRLVFCGSLAASGPSTPTHPKVESDPLTPHEWYGESKAEGERIALSFNGTGEGKLEVTVARPPRIVGPADKENLVFFRMVKKGVKLALTGTPRPLTMVDVEDVVDLMLLLATKPEAVGEAFFAAGPTTSLEEVQDIAARALNVHPRTLRLPPWALNGLSSVADVITQTTGNKLPLNRKLARQLLAPAWTCSPEKAERLLGFRAQRSIRDSLERSARWYQEHGWI